MADERSLGLIIDIDGTLLDTNYLHVVAWWRALRDNGFDIPAARVHQAIGLPGNRLVEHLTGRHSPDVVDAHARLFDEMRGSPPSHAEAVALLERCHEAGWRTVIVTSGSPDDLSWMLPAIGAEGQIDGVLTSADVEEGKPAGEPMILAIERYDLDPSSTLALGDAVWDVRAAANAGIECIALRSGGIAEQDLRGAGAIEVYEDTADLMDQFTRSSLWTRTLPS